MVSKLSILKTYYHLPLEDQFSFTYEDEHYYLTNKPFPLYYQKYISLLQINPFKIINNIYQQKNSQGYILYQVQSIPLDIQKIISLSLIPQETKTIKEIKKESNGIWILPHNPNSEFKPSFYSKEEIINKPIRIIGVAVEIRRSL